MEVYHLYINDQYYGTGNHNHIADLISDYLVVPRDEVKIELFRAEEK